jgi:hypothetical protein
VGGEGLRKKKKTRGEKEKGKGKERVASTAEGGTPSMPCSRSKKGERAQRKRKWGKRATSLKVVVGAERKVSKAKTNLFSFQKYVSKKKGGGFSLAARRSGQFKAPRMNDTRIGQGQ